MATKKLTKKQTKALLADAKKLRARDKAAAIKQSEKLTLSKDFKPNVPARTPPKDTSKRPSSRAFANNRNVIESLVEPEKVPSNYPSTMSSNRDVVNQAFKSRAAESAASTKNFILQPDGTFKEVSTEEWVKSVKKHWVPDGKKIPKGTSLNQVKAARLSKLKSAAIKVQGAEKTLNTNDGLSAAERKMAREGIAPPRAPSGAGATKAPVTTTPAAKTTAATKVSKAPTTSANVKMTRAERSAANKAAHAVNRAAEQAKWDAQKAAKTGKAPTAAKPKTTAAKSATKPVAKPAAKTTSAKPAAPAKPVVSKPAVSKPAATKATPAPKAKPQTAKPATTASVDNKPKINAERAARMGVKPVPREGVAAPARPLPMAAKPAPQGWMARNLPNVSTVLKEGLISPAGRSAALEVGKNVGKGLLSRGNVALTLLTYSPDAGNKAADDAVAARLQAAVRQGRRDAAAAKPATATAKPAQTKAATPVQRKASAAPAKKPVQKTTVSTPAKTIEVAKTNPEKAIADFEAKLRNAGVVSIAGGAGGKAQMVPQAMSVAQLEEQFKKKKGPR